MSHLLHLDSSLRTKGSRSRLLSAHYAERWRARHPGGTVTYRDLAADPVPHMDQVAFSSGFVAAADHTPEQAAARALADTLIDEVTAADTVLIALPLYNFGPPSTFKAWLDRITATRHRVAVIHDDASRRMLATGRWPGLTGDFCLRRRG